MIRCYTVMLITRNGNSQTGDSQDSFRYHPKHMGSTNAGNCHSHSVIFVNENENVEKRENNEFVNENEKMMKTKTKMPK